MWMWKIPLLFKFSEFIRHAYIKDTRELHRLMHILCGKNAKLHRQTNWKLLVHCSQVMHTHKRTNWFVHAASRRQQMPSRHKTQEHEFECCTSISINVHTPVLLSESKNPTRIFFKHLWNRYSLWWMGKVDIVKFFESKSSGLIIRESHLLYWPSFTTVILPKSPKTIFPSIVPLEKYRHRFIVCVNNSV